MTATTTAFKYRAVYLSADTEEDKWGDGCQPGTRCCKMDQKISVESDSLKGLLETLAQEWGFSEEPSDGWIMMRNHDDTVRLIYQQNENADGHPLTDSERERWKKNEIKVWLADYSFAVEKAPAETFIIGDDEAESIGLEVS